MVSIVVPSYRRAARLTECLHALAGQARAPDETIVVRRAGDEETAAAVRGQTGIHEEVVHVPGVLAAMTAGMRAARGTHIGFLDDDTRPRPDWLERCLDHLRDPLVGGVSGKDHVPVDSNGPPEPDPGRISTWGRVRGDHHRGAGPAREVDVLKGANLLFRREALYLPVALRGSGAQPHYEVAMCLAATARGWKLVFDPQIVVDHVPAQRWDADQRGAPARRSVADASYNLVRGLCALRPELLPRRALYGLLVGDRGAPGVARAVYALVTVDRETVRRLPPSLSGQLAALYDCARMRPLALAGPDGGAPAPESSS